MIRLPSTLGHFFQKIPFFQPSDPQLQELVNPIVLEKAGLTANHWFVLIVSFTVPFLRDFVVPVASRLWKVVTPKKKVDEAIEEVSNPSSSHVRVNQFTGGSELVIAPPRTLASVAALGLAIFNGSFESQKLLAFPIVVGLFNLWTLPRLISAWCRVRKESPELSRWRTFLETRKYLGVFPER